MGIKRLVFGSPKNRDRSGLDDKQVLKIATDFFRRLGDFAHSVNVQICLEPNPTCYGANFMTTTNETAFVVQNINHENIKLQIDTGAIEINIEDINSLLKKYHSFVGHIHVSEPNLLPVGDLKTNHSVFSSAIRQHLPNQIVTIEMLVGKNESALTAVERAIKFVVQNYRN
jgi:sugar phosphate isomerase/epimerase